MCGVVGFWSTAAGVERAEAEAQVARMSDRLRHRGPDDRGVWVDAGAGIALAHRRLSIIDLSQAGHQPMTSADGRYVIVYNGEVYNHDELRRQLESLGHRFRGHSDTEVIVEAWSEWGAEGCLHRLNGMFAMAVWDAHEHTLFCARDRLGIKPLYWAHFAGTVLFASELDALACHPEFRGDIDRDALASFLRHNYIPAPHSIYQDVYKLEPGMLLSLRRGRAPSVTPYWQLRSVASAGLANPLVGSEDSMVDAFDALLRDAVRRRMVADVPLGAFLSGGIDSSLIVALMQAEAARPVRTFSIGFEQRGYDEAPMARAVAEHLETDHTELYVDLQHTRDVIPKLPEIYDEPFADASQIPTFLVSEMTRRHVTVALSGDGGDELFAGYANYARAERLWRRLRWFPAPLRSAVGALLARVPFERLAARLPSHLGPNRTAYKIRKLARILTAGQDTSAYHELISHWYDPGSIVVGGGEATCPFDDPELAAVVPDLLSRMQLLDMAMYLPEDILTKVDRASMAVSLEVRVPLLDHRVVELAWRQPRAIQRADGRGKWLLRQVLYRYVPRALVDRPKSGFDVPLAEWLRGSLRSWVCDLLNGSRLRREGYLQPAPIERALREHLDGHANWANLLWGVLMFEAWLANR